MPFTIDTSGINADYPVTGEDNDSQGFRDNWAAIKNAFDDASSEISVLQNRSFTGSRGPQGPIGYAGSASNVIGYTGSASSGGGGAQGPQGPIGYTGSASGGGGGGSQGPQGPSGYTGSVGLVGYTGSGGGGGGGLVYQTTSFTAAANTQYVVDTAGGPVTITLPATPATGDYVTFTAAYLQTNTVTIFDGVVSEVYDKAIDGAKYYYDGAAWVRIQDGTVRSAVNSSVYNQVAIFDDNNSNVIRPSSVKIEYSTGEMTIAAPTAPYGGAALTVNAFTGYVGSATDPSSPAIESKGAAYTPSIELISASNVLDIDCALGNVFYITLTENISNLNLNNPRNGQTINVLFKQGPGGGFTMNWGTVSNNLKWPAAAYEPPLSTNAGKRDVFVATYIDIGADVFWYCTLTNDFTSPA